MSKPVAPSRSANELTPPGAQVERFRRDLEALTGAQPSAERRLGVAVSGGADSLALLLLAAAAWPGAVIAATVDHGLRAEAAAEAQFVHRLCEELDVPHDVLRQAGNPIAQGNLQEQARSLRYALLRDWAASRRAEWVATAHQLDDLAETFLMRARRGAGVAGLAAMRAIRPLSAVAGPTLVRPLLGWRRAELAGIVAGAGIAAVEDPSNGDPRFDRSRIRALLGTTDELPPERLALAAANLRHAEDAIAWAAAREWEARSGIVGRATVELDPLGLPYELRRRLVLRAVEQVRFEAAIPGLWHGTGIDGLVATLDGGGTGTIAEVLARAKAGSWRFAPAPPRRSH